MAFPSIISNFTHSHLHCTAVADLNRANFVQLVSSKVQPSIVPSCTARRRSASRALLFSRQRHGGEPRTFFKSCPARAMHRPLPRILPLRALHQAARSPLSHDRSRQNDKLLQRSSIPTRQRRRMLHSQDRVAQTHRFPSIGSHHTRWSRHRCAAHRRAAMASTTPRASRRRKICRRWLQSPLFANSSNSSNSRDRVTRLLSAFARMIVLRAFSKSYPYRHSSPNRTRPPRLISRLILAMFRSVAPHHRRCPLHCWFTLWLGNRRPLSASRAPRCRIRPCRRGSSSSNNSGNKGAAPPIQILVEIQTALP